MPSFGGGGQTQPAVYSQGGNPAAYIPTAQGTADTNYQNLLQGLINPSMAALNNIGQLPAAQAYPEAQYLTNLVTQNPYFGEAQTAAGLGAQYGTAAGMQNYNTGMNTFPYLAGNVTSQVPALWSGGNQILSTAFDPQQALYNQLLQQSGAQTNANLAQSGLAGTPYGVNLANEANTNFNLGWQNQQLGRQATGLGAANQAFQGANQAEALSGQLLGQGANLAASGANLVGQAGQLPFQQLNQFGMQGMGTLGNLVQLGNQQFTIPEDALNALANYLQLGRNASLAALSGGQSGFNQSMASGLGTAGLLGGGANLLFGNSLANSGGLLGLAGLSPFGASAGAGLDTAGTFFLPGTADAIGGGTAIGSLLPFLAAA